MSDVQRICVQCGQGNALDARYCARCGFDTQGALPAQSSNLPVVIGRAALPVLVGAAGLAMRMGWKLLQSRWAREAVRNTVQQAVNQASQRMANPPTMPQAAPVPRPTVPPSTMTPNSQTPKRTIHIRTAWAVNEGDGVWKQGTSEQTIEIED